jgi:hypothetical protein
MKMKFLRFCSVALVLLLSAVMAHAQGFGDKSFPAGPPKPELKYHLLVPEGVTIANKKGEVYKAGDIVLVPGANVTILESAYVKEQMKDPTFKSSFVNENQYVGIPEERVRDYAIVSIKVPEGVTVESLPWKKTSGGVTESYAGKTIKGPSSVTIMVVKAKMDATPNQTPADTWNAEGGWGGRSWNQ